MSPCPGLDPGLSKGASWGHGSSFDSSVASRPAAHAFGVAQEAHHDSASGLHRLLLQRFRDLLLVTASADDAFAVVHRKDELVVAAVPAAAHMGIVHDV